MSSSSSSLLQQERKALYSTGNLGSLYDASRDHLIDYPKIQLQTQPVKPSTSIKCEIIYGNSDSNRNILRILNIDDELRLSLLVNLANYAGIAAILNDNYRINDQTRLIYYAWTVREERVTDETLKRLNWNQLLKNDTYATHVISGITFGIEVLIVLSTPADDQILHRIRSILLNNKDMELSDDLKIVDIYSNIPDLTALKNISKCLMQIGKIKKNPQLCAPMTYSLRSLTFYCPELTRKSINYRTLPSEIRDDLETYLLDNRASIKRIKLLLNESTKYVLGGYLDGKVHGIKTQHISLNARYHKKREEISQLLTRFRRGQDEKFPIREVIDGKDGLLKTDLRQFTQNINELLSKVQLIRDLQSQNIIYCNALDRNIDENDNEHTIENKLGINTPFTCVLCSTDKINRSNNKQLNDFLTRSVDERHSNPNLRIIYADFSYCSYKLHKLMILPFEKKVPRSVSTPNERIMNILLLGETGVGKSTFINAFANYLNFQSLTEAQSKQPIVVIPVSFILTVGDQFEERTVTFGKLNPTNNEDFTAIGRSVTQRCRSYVFNLRQHGFKVRIIDTPGFGDTRGIEQDNKNMEHILQYMTNFNHLDAICFLLKPNSSRLNISFRTCLNQLFTFLAPSARKNVLFCFTNARTTFYTPGDTAPLVKQMLVSNSIQDIRFEKENTFCFDSESFRYLVALRNGVTFTEINRNEYEKSWSTSVRESHRLIEYIQTRLQSYQISKNSRSIKHAQFEILRLIQPILDKIRNCIRSQNHSNEVTNLLQRLYMASAEFSYFLIHGARSTNDDLFRMGLSRVIHGDELHKAYREYDRCLQEIASNQRQRTLGNVYNQLKIIQSFPEIYEQVQAIQQTLIKQSEILV